MKASVFRRWLVIWAYSTGAETGQKVFKIRIIHIKVAKKHDSMPFIMETLTQFRLQLKFLPRLIFKLIDVKISFLIHFIL